VGQIILDAHQHHDRPHRSHDDKRQNSRTPRASYQHLKKAA